MDEMGRARNRLAAFTDRMHLRGLAGLPPTPILDPRRFTSVYRALPSAPPSLEKHSTTGERSKDMACPHKDIRFCPLYIAAHMADGFGCALTDPDHCDAERKAIYAARTKALSETITGRVLIEQCRNAEEDAEWAAQRARNLRAMGLS